ncbi:MAG: carbon-nitrogen family hydrolase [Phycisphaerae bacterium]|nr:carbon-nitrogen family hydrolase [Phycisphaerae bacterium]
MVNMAERVLRHAIHECGWYNIPMHVAAVQFDVSWEDARSSILSASTMLAMANLPAGALAVLPETFATGFTLNAELTLAAQAETEQALSELALSLGIYLCGGLIARGKDGRAENQAVLFGPDGIVAGRYAKRHPFTLWGEEKVYAAGSDVQTFCIPDRNHHGPEGHETLGQDVQATCRLAPLICYDLRFPEDFRQAAARGAEVFLVPANWPDVRMHHWRALLIARAIENQACVVGVNRTGRDPHGTYTGGSMIVSPRGEVLAQAGEGPQILTAEIDLADLRTYRRDFPVLRDMN